MKKSLNLALSIGGELQQVKESLPHGEFTGWIKDNLDFTPRTARNYLKLHNNRNQLEGVDSIADAYKMLKPKTESVSDLEEIKRHLSSLDIDSLIPKEGSEFWLYSKTSNDAEISKQGGFDVLIIRRNGEYINPEICRTSAEYGYSIYNKRGGFKCENTEQLISGYKDKFSFLDVYAVA
jgi:hypothetical protein